MSRLINILTHPSSLIPLLVAGMLFTGCANSLWSKYQDMQCVENCDDPDPNKRKEFSQPVWQTWTMFIGETLCLIATFLLSSPLNPWRPQAVRLDTTTNSSKKPKRKGKYTSLPTEEEDSGVAFTADEERERREREELKKHSILAATVVPSHLEEHHHGHGDSKDGVGIVGATESVPRPIPAGLNESEELVIDIGGRIHHVDEDDSNLDNNNQEEDHHQPEVRSMTGWNQLLLSLPAFFDICGTTLMNAGLLFVPVSIYQMLRGALVLWVALFSVVFLKRKLTGSQWMSLATVVLGVAIVGLSGSMGGDKDVGDDGGLINGDEGEKDDVGMAAVGVLLILGAQIFTACQFVSEEKIMGRYSIEPLRAVGIEGISGLFLTSLLIIPLHFLIGITPSGKGGYFDAPAGIHQILDNKAVWHSSIGVAFSIAFFNFFGLAVTRTLSAASRSTIDTCRTLGIWLVSLALGWEQFQWLQVIGFVLLVYGTFVFNGVIDFPSFGGIFGGGKGRNKKREGVPSIVVSEHGDNDEEEEEDSHRISAEEQTRRQV